jgi:hypothetical protein
MGDRVTDRVPGSAGPPIHDSVIALDGLAYGIDQLDGLIVFHLGDGHLHAAWVPPGSGFRAEEIARNLRDVYRASMGTSNSLSSPSSSADMSEAPGLFLTIEMRSRTVMIKRSRAFGVACLFDASMPLGMARLVAMRLVSTIEPELPIVSIPPEAITEPRPQVSAARPAPSQPVIEPAPPLPLPLPLPTLAAALAPTLAPPAPPPDARRTYPEVDRDLPPRTLDFPSTGAAIVQRAIPEPPARATNAEVDRFRRALDYLRQHAPEPHVAHLRVALRAGIPPIALERPDALAANKMALVEAAVEEILGVDLSDLGSAQ